MLKRIISLIMTAVMLSALISCSAAAKTAVKTKIAQSGIAVTINGKKIEFDQEPIAENNRTLVPIRPVCEALGADVYWNDLRKTVVIVRNETKLFLTLNSAQSFVAKTNDYERIFDALEDETETKYVKLIELEAAPKALNGRTLLPIRAVCEELGATVNWNGSENLIEISAKKTSKNTDKDFFDEFCDWANIRLLVDNVWHRPSFRKQNHGNTQLYDIFPKEFKYSWSLIYDCCVVENDTYFYENGTGRDSWGGRYDYDFDGKTLLLYNRDGTTTYTYDTQTGNFVAKGEIWLNLDGSKLGNEYLIPHKNMITPEQAVEMVKAYQDDVYCFRFWDSFDDEFYYIQHYEDMETHTATEGRYYVNKWTGEVICCL